ncbi:MAG TPA: hypothetical protein VG206_23735 [Terriglobia bacterium]|nr:hypothetical protein [Terriglobia bacterium]
MLGTILKWVGGTAAVISLVTGMVQVNGLFRTRQSRQEAVTELVKGARLQASASDYAGAWKLYEQALQLEPGSRAARDGQGDLAMQWLRNMRVSDNQSFSQLVDPLLPVLYRAAASGNARKSADALAHIGWANYLKNRDFGTASSGELAGPKVEEQFQAALKADGGNVYAHAMWGFWVAYRRAPLSEADQHFSEALKTGRERQYVQSLQISAYLNRQGDAESDVELIRVADQIRRNHEAIAPDEQRRIVESVYLGSADTTEGVVNRIVSAIPPADHLATLTWLIQGTNLDSDRRYRFYHARLSESAGDRSTALAEYKALQSLSSPLERVLAQQVALGIDRISRQGAETLEQK